MKKTSTKIGTNNATRHSATDTRILGEGRDGCAGAAGRGIDRRASNGLPGVDAERDYRATHAGEPRVLEPKVGLPLDVGRCRRDEHHAANNGPHEELKQVVNVVYTRDLVENKFAQEQHEADDDHRPGFEPQQLIWQHDDVGESRERRQQARSE